MNDMRIPCRASFVYQIAQDAKFSGGDFVKYPTTDEIRSIVSEAIHACWRGDFKTDAERLDYLRACLEGYIDEWAETEVEE